MATDTIPAAVPGPSDPPDSTPVNGARAGWLASTLAPVDPARPTFDLAPEAAAGDPQALSVDGTSADHHGHDDAPEKPGAAAGKSIQKQGIWRAWLLAGANRWGKGGGSLNKRLDLAKAKAQANQVKTARQVTINRSGGLLGNRPSGSGASGGSGGKSLGSKGSQNGSAGSPKSPKNSNGSAHGSTGHGAGGHSGSGDGSGSGGGGGRGPGGGGVPGGRGNGSPNSSGGGRGGSSRSPKAGGSGGGSGPGNTGGSSGGKTGASGSSGAPGKDGSRSGSGSGGKGSGPSSGSKNSKGSESGGSKSGHSLKKDSTGGKRSDGHSSKDSGAKGSKGSKSGSDASGRSTGGPGGTSSSSTGSRANRDRKGGRPLDTRESREAGYRDGTRVGRVVAHVKSYGHGVKDGWDEISEAAGREKALLDEARDQCRARAQGAPQDQASAIEDDNEPMEDPFMAQATPIQAKGIDKQKITLGDSFRKSSVTRGELRTFKGYEGRLEARIDGLSKIADATKSLAVQAREQAAECQKLAEEVKGIKGGEKLTGELQKLADKAKAQADEADEVHKRAARSHDFAKGVLSNIQTRYAPLYQAVVDSDEVKPGELKFYADRGVTRSDAALAA
jgi:hypothetical protein